MNIVHYHPWNTFDKLANELNGLFNSRPLTKASTVTNTTWSPAVDIRELEDRFILTVDVPGVDPKDIEITMENNVLTLKGERNYVSEDSGKDFKYSERVQGRFYRRFSLPDEVDTDNIEAQGENGVLSISIVKKERAQPRRISVAA